MAFVIAFGRDNDMEIGPALVAGGAQHAEYTPSALLAECRGLQSAHRVRGRPI